MRSLDAHDASRTVFVVSGLPRSGTSLAMQMLRAGGIVVLDDEQRAADDDNPRGYLEYSRTLGLWQDASWLGEAVGKAIKIVTPLLPALPLDYDYAVLLIERDPIEVMASQAAMLRRHGAPAAPPEAFAELIQLLARFKRWVRYEPNFRCLELSYRELIATPAEHAARIANFFDRELDRAEMARAVDPALHRQRRSVG